MGLRVAVDRHGIGDDRPADRRRAAAPRRDRQVADGADAAWRAPSRPTWVHRHPAGQDAPRSHAPPGAKPGLRRERVRRADQPGRPGSHLDGFTVTSYRFEEMLGYGYTASELATLYRYWQFAANVLGNDHRLVEGISNNEQAGRVDDLFQAVTGPPIEESGTLAAATISSVSSLLHDVMNVP